MADKQTSRVEALLSFFRLPFRVSATDEVETTCIHCGKERHFYATEKEGHIVYNCKACHEVGEETRFVDRLISRLLEDSIPDPEFWNFRGIPEDVAKDLNLCFSPTFNRHLIPYHGERGYTNVAMRAVNGEEPKYLRPPLSVSPYTLGEECDTVVLTEGEIDAISAYVLLKDYPQKFQILGLPGAGFSSKKVLSQYESKTVIAITDNDAAGRKAARRIQEILPAATIAELPVGVKDLNELLVTGGSDAADVIIRAAQESPDTRTVLGPVTMRDFLSRPPKENLWMIPDLLAQDALAILAGMPKTRKSLLSLYLAYQVAEGRKFLGRDIQRPGPVILCNQEDSERVLYERLKTLSSYGSSNLHLLIPSRTGWNVKFSDAASMDRLEQYVQELRPVLIVIDPLANAIGALDENSASEVNRLMEQMRHLRDRYHTSVVLVHHTRKATDDEHLSGYALRGSSVFFAKVESLWMLQDVYNGTTRLMSIQKSGTPRTFELYFRDGEFGLIDEGGGHSILEGSTGRSLGRE